MGGRGHAQVSAHVVEALGVIQYAWTNPEDDVSGYHDTIVESYATCREVGASLVQWVET